MKQKQKTQQASPASHKKRQLNAEEDALWQQVRKTVQPVSTKAQNLKHWLDNEPSTPLSLAPETIITDAPVYKKPVSSIRQFPAASYAPPVSEPKLNTVLPSSIDDKTARKLVKGKQAIDARIDLHGMTQARAHRFLQDFVFHQYHSGSRIVLVITGKGRLQEGVLRNAVPRWLRDSDLAEYVSAFRIAHIAHGGEGALYVRLRNKDKAGKRKIR